LEELGGGNESEDSLVLVAEVVLIGPTTCSDGLPFLVSPESEITIYSSLGGREGVGYVKKDGDMDAKTAWSRVKTSVLPKLPQSIGGNEAGKHTSNLGRRVEQLEAIARRYRVRIPPLMERQFSFREDTV
ncbi:8766_t:CDS:2, partial [Scutellospora calospora]